MVCDIVLQPSRIAALVPITGITLITAVIPLTTYTLLILFRSFATGFTSVPGEILEAAEGMGYTRGQRLFRVELPLAVPLLAVHGVEIFRANAEIAFGLALAVEPPRYVAAHGLIPSDLRGTVR